MKRRKGGWAGVAALSAWLVAAGALEGALPGDYLHRFDPQRITPHVAWAKPWARGRLKLLLLVQTYVGSRDATELWQRLDSDLKVVTVRSRHRFVAEDPYHQQVAGTSLAAKTAELREALQDRYDAIVLAHFALAALPLELQVRLLEQVAAGTGLVLTHGMQDKPAFLRKPTEEDRQLLLGSPAVRTFRLKQGRIAVLDYGPPSDNYWGAGALCPVEPWSFQAQTSFEYHMAVVIRAILWASRTRQPELVWKSVPERLELDRQAMPAKVTLAVHNPRGSAVPAVRRCAVRDPVGTVEHEAEEAVEIAPGRSEQEVTVPRLPAGRHVLDVWLADAAGVLNWASVPVSVKSATALAEVTLATAFVPPKAVLRGTAGVRLEPGGPRPTALRLELVDTDGRLMERRSCAWSGPTTSFELPVRRPLTLAGRLRVALTAGQEVLDTRDLEVFFPQRDPGPFVGVTWNINSNSRGVHMKLAADLLREAGFRAALSAQGSSAEFAREYNLCGMLMVPAVTHIPPHAKGFQFSSAKEREQIQKSALAHGREKAPYSVLVYNLGDENYMPPELATEGEDLAAFRQWLAAKYGSIEKLNAAWGTAHPAWDQVPPPNVADGRQRRHATAWHDFMTFREFLYADLHHYWAHWLQQGDPQARVGAEGSEPGDLEKTLPGLGLWSPYQQRWYNALLNSLAPRTLWRGNWWGGYVSQRRGTMRQWMLWTSLLDGCNSIWCFESDCSAEGIFNLDLRFADHFAPLLPLLDEVFGGVGPLLATSRFPQDGVAMHHSAASVHAADLLVETEGVHRAQDAWLGFFQEMGVSVQHLTTSQIERGDLRWPTWRLLVLPCSVAISDAEATAIRRFVAAGGHVIADVRPGVLRGDAGPRPAGVLDDLFSQGRAVLLDTALTRLHSGADRQQVRSKLLSTLTEAGVGRRWTVARADGSPAPGVRLAAFERPGARILGLLSRERAEGLRVTLTAPATVYDIRQRRGLGQAQREVSLELQPGEATLLALCDEPVTRLEIVAPKTAAAGDVMPVRVRVQGAKAPLEARVLRLDVYAPAGKRLFQHRQVLVPDKAEAATEVPIAYNEPPGAWRITVRDVLTGTEAEHGLTVRGGDK